jgi:phage-related protein
MRTKAENIDGRDGDIITELGFSAYDKEVKIALTYDYNVDDIISFFKTSGRVVFSNEADKYYRFAMYDKIDFERLIRFKKAKVNLHVQPFKYSDVESKEDYTFTSTMRTIHVINQGNYFSRPTVSITASGDVEFFINDVKILEIEFGSTPRTIILDSEAMNATNEDGTIFLNRLVSGNYDNIKLRSGENKISFTGSVTRVSIINRSRWL